MLVTKMKKYLTIRNLINLILLPLYLFILAAHFETILDKKLYTDPLVVFSDEKPWVLYNKTVYISFMITTTAAFTGLLMWGIWTYKKAPKRMTKILSIPVLYMLMWIILQVLFWPNYKG